MTFLKLKDGTVVSSTEQHDKNDIVETMKLRTEDIGFEKHVPFIEIIDNVIHSRTGKDIMHPATNEHYMAWFKLIHDNKVIETITLEHTANPAVVFKTPADGKQYDVYVFCNLHGVWKGSI